MPRLKIPLQHKFLAVFVLIYTLATTLVLFVCYYKTIGLMIDSTDNLLTSHLRELRRVCIEEGEASIIKDIHEEVNEIGTSSAFFIYNSAGGSIEAAGDIDRWSALLDRYKSGSLNKLSSSPITVKTSQGIARVALIDTPEGNIIIGALSLKYLNVLAKRYFEIGVIAVIALILAASIGVYYLLRGMLSQVRDIALQAERIDSIGTQARLPTTGTGNEFDMLAEAINRLLIQLQRSKEAFLQTADHLAHELRTPLSRLKSSAELSLSKQDSELASHTFEQVETMLELTNSMLDLSILEVERKVPAPEVLRIESIVSQAVALYDDDARDRDVILKSSNSSSIRPVLGNRNILERVISNLIDNALKYSDSGPITVSIHEIGSKIRIGIENNGPEIPAEYQERIFERFVRIPNSDTEKPPGFGLGLSFVKAAIEAHGGHTWLESVNSKTIFFIEIPAIDPSSSLR